MQHHANAKTTFQSRAVLVERLNDDTLKNTSVCEGMGCSTKTGRKWQQRFAAEGYKGLENRSTAPKTVANKTPQDRRDAICDVRKYCRLTGETIAELLDMPQSTVSSILRQNNLSKQSDLDPIPSPNRYVRRHCGELIHIDIKRLSRFEKPGHALTGDRSKKTKKAGYEYLHVCVDSASRIGYAEIFPDQSAKSAKQFLLNAIRHFRALGVVVKEVMTDNGGCYRSKIHKRLCHLLGLKHRRTRPYTPKTNGKAERFIQTCLRSWVYGRLYETSDERNAALAPWLHRYNYERKHRGIDRLTPMAKLAQLQAVETEQCG